MNIYRFHNNIDELIQLDYESSVIPSDIALEMILNGKQIRNVGGSLDFHKIPLRLLGLARGLTNLPDNLTVQGDLNLLNWRELEELPDNLTVQGDLNLGDTQIKSLPGNLVVNGHLNLSRTPNLDKDNLPSSLVVDGEIVNNNDKPLHGK